MNDANKIILSILGSTLFIIGALAVLYVTYGQYVRIKCESRMDKMLTQDIALESTGSSSLSVATSSAGLDQSEPLEATPSPTKVLKKVSPSSTPTPTP